MVSARVDRKTREPGLRGEVRVPPPGGAVVDTLDGGKPTRSDCPGRPLPRHSAL
jgi:hypothetical protein